MTVKNLEIEEAKEKRREVERKKLAEERKKYTLSMIEKDAKKDFEMERDENALLGKEGDVHRLFLSVLRTWTMSKLTFYFRGM